MNLKNIWRGNVGLKGVVLVALVSLVVGLGISGSLDWLSPSRAVNMMGESGSPDPRSRGACAKQSGNEERNRRRAAGCRQALQHHVYIRLLRIRARWENRER